MSVDQLPPGKARAPQRDAQLVRYDEYIDRQIEATRRTVKVVDIMTALLTMVIGTLGFLLTAAAAEHWLVPDGFNLAERMVLFVLLFGALAFYTTRKLWPLVVGSINPAYAAQAIEHDNPSLKNSLLNLLLFRERRDDVTDAVYETLEEQAARRLTRVQVDSAVDRTQLLRLGYVLVGVIAALALYKILSPKDPFVSAERLLMPWARIAPASRVVIENVEPGVVTLARGEVLTVSADVRGIGADDPVVIRYTTADGQALDRPATMKPSAAGLRFTGQIPPAEDGARGGVAQNLRYRIEAGDARSLDYAVTVVAAPTITVDRIDYDYPDYTGFADRSIDRLGDIRAIEGTRVTIHARANEPIQEADIDFEADGRRDLRLKHTGSVAVATFTLELRDDRQTPKFTSYALRFTTAAGRPNRDPVKFPIDVLPDQLPEASILAPADKTRDVRLDETVAIEVDARDPDFALAEVRLVGETAGNRVVDLQLLTKEHTGRFTGRVLFTPHEHDLKPGDVLRYWVTARDNRAPKPNEVASDSQTLRITGPNQQPGQPPQDRVAQRDQRQQQENGDQGESDGESASADGNSGDAGGSSSSSSDGGEQGKSGGDPQPGESASADGSSNQPGEQSSNNQPGESGGDSNSQNQSGDQQSENQGQSSTSKSGNESDNSNPQQGESASTDGQSDQTGNSSNTSQNSSPGESASADGNSDQQGNNSSSESGANSKPGTSQPNNTNHPQPSSDSQPISSEGDNDADAFERIQDFLKQQGKLPQDQQGESSNKSQGEPQSANEGKSEGESASADGQKDQQRDKSSSDPNNGDNADSKQDQNQGEPASAGGSETQSEDSGEPSSDESSNPNANQDQPSQSTDGQHTSSEGESAAGNEPQESKGSPETGDQQSKPGDMKPGDQEKWQQRPSGDKQGEQQDPASGGQGKKKNDSQGDEGGDRTGGGDQGAGQKSERDGTGSDGQNQSADEGLGQSSERGPGDKSSDAGTQTKSDRPTGQPGSGEKGNGSSEREGTGDQPGGAQNQQSESAGASASGSQEATDGNQPENANEGSNSSNEQASNQKSGKPNAQQNSQPSDSQQPKSEQPISDQQNKNGSSADDPNSKQPNGDQSQADQPSPTSQNSSSQSGSNPDGAGRVPNGKIEPSASTGEASAADAANLDYARKQTDLVLETLADQMKRKKVDPRLLDKLGWTEADLKRFLDRWQQLKAAADANSPVADEAQRELDDALRSLGLRRGQLQQSKVSDDTDRNLRQGYRGPVPLEYQERLRAYNQGVSRARDSGE